MVELPAGAVLGQSFSIAFKLFVPFAALAVLVYSPLLIYTVTLLSGDLTEEGLQLFDHISTANSVLLEPLLIAAVIYGVFETSAGRSPAMGAVFGMGLKRLLPVLGTSLLVGAAILLGLLVLVIPGIYLACRLWLVVPATAVEKVSGMEAIRRGQALSAGVRPTIFLIIAAFFVLELAVIKVFEATLLASPTENHIKVYLVVATVALIIVSILKASASAVAYFRLRQVREGADTVHLASVFD